MAAPGVASCVPPYTVYITVYIRWPIFTRKAVLRNCYDTFIAWYKAYKMEIEVRILSGTPYWTSTKKFRLIEEFHEYSLTSSGMTHKMFVGTSIFNKRPCLVDELAASPLIPDRYQSRIVRPAQ